jgi:ribose-phosphate pyrophosphokinase
MAPRIVPGPASERLAAMISHHLDDEPVPCTVNRFPDGELLPELATVRGDDVYVVQSTGPPVNDRLVELLLLLDACRRAGAGRITAVVPYFGYARQDRRSRPGQAIGARAVADALTATGANRLLVVDPHTPSLEAMFAIPVELLTAIPVLVPALADLPADAVVVAPDLGAVKLAERVAARLDRPVAVVRKTFPGEDFGDELVVAEYLEARSRAARSRRVPTPRAVPRVDDLDGGLRARPRRPVCRS